MYTFKIIAICGSSALHVWDSTKFSEIPAETVETWETENIKIAAFRSGQSYIVAFHLRHDAELIRIEKCSLSPLHEVDSIWSDVPPNVCIHSSIVDDVQKFVSSNVHKELVHFLKERQGDNEIYFTGYSLGGLISQLIMLHAVQSCLSQQNLTCITFGKPLSGNLAFARYFNNRIQHCSNFLAKGDRILEYFKALHKNELGLSEFHEDTEAIVLDNDEEIANQTDEDLTAHDPEYYWRCCTNLYKRKKQVQNLNLDAQSASFLLIRFFRTHAYQNSLRCQVSRVQRTKIISEWMLNVPFEEVASRLRVKWVIACMKKTLETFLYLATRAKIKTKLPSDGNSNLDQERPNVRVFLAAFMIDARPSSCFENIGHLEKQVQDAAADLVKTFKQICARIEGSKSNPVTLHDWCSWISFLKQLNVYLARFKDWKVPDEHKLTERIKHALLALYRAESHLSPEAQEYMSMKEEFRAQKAKLRAKMLQIAGAQGLESFDEALRQQGFTAVDAEPSEETASSSSQGAGSSSRPAELPSSTNASGLSSLPGRMTNEQLAHELLLDPAFKLDEQGAGYLDNPVLSKVRESFKVAFWDSLVDDLRLTPPCYVRVLKVVGEVRDGMIDLSPSRSKELKEKIDTAYWQEQIESGALDWSSCVSLIEGMLGIAMEMQEPSRKQETQAGWKALEQELRASTPEDQPTLFCTALEYVLGRVNVMRVDAANARLRNIAHVIQNHGIEYERAHMDKKIKANPAYLQRTPEWIRAQVEKEVGRGRADLSKLVQGEGAAYEQIHTAAVLSLIMGSEPVKTDACPETLQLDISRLHKYHADFHFDVLAACMLAVASQRLMATKKDPKVTELLEHLKTSLNSFEASLVDKEERVKAATSSFEAELSAAEKEVIASCLSPSQPSAYSREMLERLLEVPAMVLEKSYGPMEEQWLRLVSADGSKVESDVPQSPFVRNVYERVVRNARRVRKVISLNRKVHYDRYNQMILAESQEFKLGMQQQTEKSQTTSTSNFVGASSSSKGPGDDMQVGACDTVLAVSDDSAGAVGFTVSEESKEKVTDDEKSTRSPGAADESSSKKARL